MIKEYNTIKDLLNEPSPRGVIGIVKGYYGIDDNGGGTFYWYDGLDTGPDDGIIFQSNVISPGRWVRKFNQANPILADWFGIRTGRNLTIASNNLTKINNCIRNYKRIKFSPGEYCIYQTQTESTIILHSDSFGAPGPTIEGSGIDRTFIKMLTSYDTDRITAFTTLGWPSDMCVIRDLTIDCGFNDVSNKIASRQAIKIRGAFSLIERVKFVNFGAGIHTSRAECFVLSLLLTPVHTELTTSCPGTVRDCIFTQPGNNGSLTYNNGVPEITCVLLDRDDIQQTVLGHGGLVTGNTFFSMKVKSNEQKSSLHGISVGRMREAKIQNNLFTNFDGACIYQDSFNSKDLLIQNNSMHNVNVGAAFLIVSKDFNPIFEGIRFVDNFIVLGKATAESDVPSYLAGISFYSQSGVTGDRIKNILIKNNNISGKEIVQSTPTGSKSTYPMGIRIELYEPVFSNIRIEDNILDIPDTSLVDADSFGVKGEESLVFIPDYRYDNKKVKIHNNTDINGNPLKLKVTRSGVKLWKSITNKTERLVSVLFEERVTLLYEDFVGAAPRFSLGWDSITTGKAKISSVAGDSLKSGVVEIVTYESPDLAVLSWNDKAIKLSNDRTHTLEFSFSRNSNTASYLNYESILGFIQPSDNQGIYLKINNSTGGQIVLVTRGSNGETVTPTNEFAWAGWWFKCKLEVNSSEVNLWINDRWVNTARTNIPLSLITVGFKSFKLVGNLPTGILLDYVQYQVV